MKIIIFNNRGLGGWEERREVLRLVKDKCPTVLCIHKTKLRC